MTTEASTEQPAAFLSCSGQPQKKVSQSCMEFVFQFPRYQIIVAVTKEYNFLTFHNKWEEKLEKLYENKYKFVTYLKLCLD